MRRPGQFMLMSAALFLFMCPVWVAGPAPGVVDPLVPALQAAGQSPTAAHMKEHFDKVAVIEAAVIRGDLESVREPAQWMAEHEMGGWPPKTASQISAMHLAAKRAAEATDLATAASATATMAATCGTCHRTSNVQPKLPEPKAPEGAGTAGHMRAHQQAVDYMYQGLVVPSDALWNKGAELLKAAPLAQDAFPTDPKLTAEIKAYEVKVHEMADSARKAAQPSARVAVYSQIIAGCAECHGLHGRVWGPGVPKD